MSHENALPKSVQQQIAAADEIYKAVYADEETPAEEPKQEEPEQEEPKSEPKSEPPQEDGWEHKFKVLQGKYNKEVPTLHRQLREATQQNGILKDRIDSLEARMKQLLDQPKQPDTPALTQDEIDQFGPDLIDIIRRVTRQETGVVLDEQLKPVKESVKQVQEKVAQEEETDVESARRQMLIDLGEAVPDWETQNEDLKFLAWLDQKDPMSGQVRMKNLADAYANCDAETVINIFKGFQKENAVVNPKDEPSDETPAEEKPEQPLEDLVAPGTPKTGSAGAQNESGKKIWTQKEIRDFYTRKNEFIKAHPEKDLPENIVAQERDIFKAQHEDRIRP